MCPKNYNEEFPKNTRKILETYYDSIKKDTGLEATFLLNCLLGLIVIVYEKNKDKLDNIKVSYFSDCLPDSYEYLNGSSIKTRKKEQYKDAKAKSFVKRIRDGIAHQHITANSDADENWISVTIKDFSNEGKNKGKENFVITISIEQLKRLAIAISELVPVHEG